MQIPPPQFGPGFRPHPRFGAFQENATQYDRKRPAHTVAEVVTTGSKLAPFWHIDIKFLREEMPAQETPKQIL